MIRKTYGVSGLTDWTAQIKAGKGTVLLHFTGGALTAFGVTPAKFSTSSLFFQSVIEDSEPFKGGRIQLLDTMEVADDATVKKRKLCAHIHAESPERETDEAKQETLDETSGQSPADTTHGFKAVEVADRSDAIEYLKENYPDKGYGAVKLRTKTAFDAACAEHGIRFVYAS